MQSKCHAYEWDAGSSYALLRYFVICYAAKRCVTGVKTFLTACSSVD